MIARFSKFSQNWLSHEWWDLHGESLFYAMQNVEGYRTYAISVGPEGVKQLTKEQFLEGWAEARRISETQDEHNEAMRKARDQILGAMAERDEKRRQPKSN